MTGSTSPCPPPPGAARESSRSLSVHPRRSVGLAAGALAVTGPPGSAATDAQSAAVSRLQADGDRQRHADPGRGGVTSPSSAPGSVPRSTTRRCRGRPRWPTRQPPTWSGTARRSAPTGRGRPWCSAGSPHTPAGTDVVRYSQHVGGVRVLGGDVVLTLGADRELVSVLSTMSRTGKVPAPTISQSEGRRPGAPPSARAARAVRRPSPPGPLDPRPGRARHPSPGCARRLAVRGQPRAWTSTATC